MSTNKCAGTRKSTKGKIRWDSKFTEKWEEGKVQLIVVPMGSTLDGRCVWNNIDKFACLD